MAIDPTQYDVIDPQDVGAAPAGTVVGDDALVLLTLGPNAATPNLTIEYPLADLRQQINPEDLWRETAPLTAGAPNTPGRIGQKYYHGKAGNALDIYQHNGTTWVLKRSIGVTNTTPGQATNTVPNVTLGVSVANLILGGTLTLTVQAEDSDGIDRVVFFEGATPLDTKTTAPYLLDVKPATVGTKSYTATAYDKLGASRSTPPQSVQVFAAANQLPTVTGSLSNNTVTVGQSLTISALANDPDGTIAKVEFFDSSTKIGEATSTPYSITYAPGQAGNRQIFIKATDNAGGSRQTDSLSLTVNAAPGNQKPTVSLSVQGAAVQGNTINLAATAADSDGSVTKVEFFDSNKLLGTVTQTPYALPYTLPAAGTYFFTAKATDNQGGTAETAISFLLASAPPSTATTPPAPTFSGLVDTQDGGQVTLDVVAPLILSDYRVSLPGSADFATPSSATIAVGNVAGTVRAYVAAGPSRNQSPTGTSAAFTSYTPPATTNAAPTVTSFSVNSTSLTSGQNLTFTAAATDSDGSVASIRIYEGTSVVATITGASGSASITPAAGNRTYAAKAVDNAGLEGAAFATTRTVTVTASPPTPPSYNTSITGIAPNETADGVEMTVADGVNLIMRWNAPLPTGDLSPASTAVFYNGSQLAAVYFNAAPGVLGTACEFEYQGVKYQKTFSTSDIVLA